MQKSTKVVSRHVDTYEANLVKGRLVSAGIDAHVQHDNIVTMVWTLSNAVGGVRVIVPIEQYEDARAILADESLVPDLKTVEGWSVRCPECSSTDVQENRSNWKKAFAFLYLLSIPIPFTRGTYTCNDCGWEWREADEELDEPTQAS